MFKEIEKIAEKAGKIMLDAVNMEACVSEKTSNSDIVTEYDVKVQNYIFENLRKLCPDAYFFGEEDSRAEGGKVLSGKAFIVDPIDGTTNFVRGFRKSAVSIAYCEDGEAVFGVCYIPYYDELFTAVKGEGAYLGGKRIQCSERSIEHAVVMCGTTPYMKKETTDATFEIMQSLFGEAMDIRRMGSAVIDLLEVACGRAELFFEIRLSPWDYAAAGLIASEAGASVTTMSGEKLALDRKQSVLAANPECKKFFMECQKIQKYRDLF